MRSMQQLLDIFKKHIGHKIQFYENSTPKNYSILLRCNISTNVSGAIELWVEGENFPKKLFHDQALNCECMEKKK